jgi:hypothetical protein
MDCALPGGKVERVAHRRIVQAPGEMQAPRCSLTGAYKYKTDVVGCGVEKKGVAQARARGRSGNLSQCRASDFRQSGLRVGKCGEGTRQAARTKEHGATRERTTGPAARSPRSASAAGGNVEGSTDDQVGLDWRGPGWGRFGSGALSLADPMGPPPTIIMGEGERIGGYA